MKIGEQKIIDNLEEKISMGKKLLKYFHEDETEETKKCKAFLKQEVSICKTMVVLIKTGS